MNRGDPKLYTVASGKGGVGKTSLTLNLAAVLAKQGRRVLVVDGDTGLANADVQLNLKPAYDLADALQGQRTLADIITPTPYGFALIAGRSGHPGLASLPLPTLTTWLNDLRALGADYDLILLDAAAGIAPPTLLMAAQSAATLLITTPDPSSLTDAYALVKLLWLQHGVANARLVVNQATAREAAQVHTRLNAAATGFLQLPPLPLVGKIPSCKFFAQAVRNHELAFKAFPRSTAVAALATLAKTL
ncbi:MAG: AAA family ATPase [Alphaproteobacteria bacterium]|nr:AAA family ATPase [Alphaproteobacteria bacterium]